MLRLILLLIVPSLVAATAKKGFGLCGAAYRCGDTYALSDTSWWYNWHPTRTEYQHHKCSKYPRGDFVPTIWGERDLNAKLPSDTKYVLAFNEPNAQNQANLSPEAAAKHWPEIEKMAGSRIIVGPGLTSCDTHPEWCTGWFDRFFKACPKCRVNHMAMHAYHCDAQKIMNSLHMISKRYGKKVWLTEFACETSKSIDDQIHLMKTLIPQLEKADYVYRYAWFCSRLRDDGHHWNLINQNSPTLNRLDPSSDILLRQYALSDTSWWYNWHPTRTEYQHHKCSKYPRGDFVPTIWGERDLNAKLPSDTKYVLAFNEPNAQNQANLSPEAAAKHWPEIEKMAGSRIIVGPGLTSCDTHPEWCTGWFDRFFKACPKCRVNHMAMHAYHCDAQKIMNSLHMISKRYGKKVWLTEFACETSKSIDDQIHQIYKKCIYID